MVARELFVVSDLHIGGAYPPLGDPAARGFRLCTHVGDLADFVRSLPRSTPHRAVELVINGDFVDFLAEPEVPAGDTEGARWRPFIESPAEAAKVFLQIAQRDAVLFGALADFLKRGGRLTLLLGNHDIELALPAVRRQLEGVLDSAGRDLAFIHDGEAYRVGPVLIEHGNRYDPWNVVHHDSLRRLRSAQSRGEQGQVEFTPPAGSHLVAGVINRIKQDYPFVDLLKPESEAVLPILLALAPEYRRHILAAARLAARAHLRRLELTVSRSVSGDIGMAGGAPADGREEVMAALRSLLPPQDLAAFVSATLGDAQDLSGRAGDIAAGGLARTSAWAWIQLLSRSKAEPLEQRLPALRLALDATRRAFDFCRDREHRRYLDPAQRMCDAGARVVVFGHTHLAKKIALEGGGLYLNTGTWSDLIRFPDELLDAPAPGQPDPLLAFVEDMKHARFDGRAGFAPTYAHILVKGDDVVSADLVEFNKGATHGS